MRDQIQLLGHPDQRADIADRARAHRLRGAQIRQRWRPQPAPARPGVRRSDPLRIPHRLSSDPVAMAVDFSFEDVHLLSCSIFKAKNQAKSSISAVFRLGEASEMSQGVRR